MISLNDGRSELFQWDTARKLTVDAECSQVHFSNKAYGTSIDVSVIDGVADIPDILLQSDRDLHVWAYVGTPEDGYTKITKTFKVNHRNKPAGYIYTPPEKPDTSVSWNDLEDKPFYDTRETTIIPRVHIEWDGDTTGKVTDSQENYYKVSDMTFTNEEARKLKFTTTSSTIDLSTVYSFWDGDDWFGNGEQGLLIIRKAGEFDGFNGTYVAATFPETGVYFGTGGYGIGRSLIGEDDVFETGKLKQIEEKYIPGDIYSEEDVLFSGDAVFTGAVSGIQVAAATIQLAPYDLKAGDEISILYHDTSYSVTETLKTTQDDFYISCLRYTPNTGVTRVYGDYQDETRPITIKRTKAATKRLNFDAMPKSQITQMVLAAIQPAEEESF